LIKRGLGELISIYCWNVATWWFHHVPEASPSIFTNRVSQRVQCETGLSELLGFVVRIASAPPTQIKWIVSSGNRPNIERRLTLADAGVRLSLEVNAKLISHAIDVYIDIRYLNLRG
jgi:hypothetical protein